MASNYFDKASLVMIPDAPLEGKVLSVKPEDRSGDFTFTRGSNLAATRVDANGLIEKGRENLLLQSNQFDTTWNTFTASVTEGQAGYDGSSNAWVLDVSVANGSVYQSINQNNLLTASIYAKKGTANGVRFRMDHNIDSNVYVDLRDGSLSDSTNSAAINIQDVGNGWYRISVAFVAVNMATIVVYPTDGNTTSSTGTIYIQDAQLESGLVATDYIETGASTAQAGILEDLPRLDYSGGASCPSLLLEPQRTNNVPHSEYLEGLSSVNASLSANEAISPDSGNNATKLGAFVATPNSQWARYYNIVQPNQKQALSIYAKAGNINDFTITYYDQSTGDLFFNYDLGAGSVSAPTGNANYVDADIQDLGNGWYRCIAVVNAQASGTNAEFQVSAGFNREVPNIGDYVYIYGYQWEQNASYPTSYIPTMGSAVTRSSDAMANLDIPDFNDNTSFSVLLELTRNGISSSEIGSMFSFYNDSLTQQFWFHIDAPNAQVRLRDATNSNATMATISFDTDDRKKIAFSCDGSTLKTYADGVLSNTYNLVNVFNVDELRTAAKSFDVHQIVTFPTALTDSECIALTTI